MRYEDRDVYEELFKIGLTEEEIDKQFEINVDLKVVLGADIKQEIEFLKQYNLTEEDIAEISRKNPWILTEDFQRIRFLEKYYGEVDIKDLGELLKKQSISMAAAIAVTRKGAQPSVPWRKEIDEFLSQQG